jgi:hypothetical protein
LTFLANQTHFMSWWCRCGDWVNIFILHKKIYSWIEGKLTHFSHLWFIYIVALTMADNTKIEQSRCVCTLFQEATEAFFRIWNHICH